MPLIPKEVQVTPKKAISRWGSQDNLFKEEKIQRFSIKLKFQVKAFSLSFTKNFGLKARLNYRQPPRTYYQFFNYHKNIFLFLIIFWWFKRIYLFHSHICIWNISVQLKIFLVLILTSLDKLWKNIHWHCYNVQRYNLTINLLFDLIVGKKNQLRIVVPMIGNFRLHPPYPKKITFRSLRCIFYGQTWDEWRNGDGNTDIKL